MPGVDEFQKDPLAALGKGFGWFSGVVGKTAKSVNDGYIQPTARQVCHSHTTSAQIDYTPNIEQAFFKHEHSLITSPPQVAESDFAKQASIAASTAAKNASLGARSAAENFNRFVEGQDNAAASRSRQAPIDESRKDFWDSFGDAGTAKQGSGSSAIGTSAMKKGGAKKEDDGWEKW